MLSEKDDVEDCLDTIKERAYKTKKLYEILERTLLASGVSNCSCPECDSLRCFTIRRELANSLCTCNDCQQSNTCLLQVDEKSRDSKPILRGPKSEENTKSSQKSVDFCDKTNYHEIIKMQDGEIDRTIQSEFYYTSDNNQFNDESIQPQETAYTRVQSAILKYPKNNISKTTAHLSAQIMNVPIQDFNDSLSVSQSNEKNGSDVTNVKQDIFSRLKEIYKACSCKVCECIPVSSFFNRTDVCSCKPCECSECKHLYQYVSNIKENSHGGCPCIRCDRKDCRGVTKEKTVQRNCTCKPCDCIKCSESFSKPCSCDPCKCLECRNMPSYLARSVVVAPVTENIQSRNLCDCSPCECSNCTHNYNTTSNLRETSTGTVAHSYCPCEICPNDLCQTNGANCRCEVSKGIMKKPIQRDRHDYDIRRLLLTDAWLNRAEDKNKLQPDIITMHAEIKQKRLGISAKECQCEDCSCITCIKLNTKRKLVPSRRQSIPDLPCLKNVCRCEPCECSNCSKYVLRANDSKTYHSKCKCNICDCINCTNVEETRNPHVVNLSPLRQEFVANYVPNHCDCNSCECINCLKRNVELIYENVPTRDVIKNEQKVVLIGSTNFDEHDFEERKSEKPSKPFLKAMTRGNYIEPSRSIKVLKSKQRVSVYQARSLQHNTSESSLTMLDCNTDDSVTYFSAENSNVKLTPMDDDKINKKKKEIFFYDNNAIADNAQSSVGSASLFYENPKIICINTELSRNKSHFQDDITVQPFLDLPEFDTDQYYKVSESTKNCIENCYQQFFPSCIESIDTLQQSSTPRDPLNLNNIPYKYNVKFDYDRVLTTLQDAQEFQGKLNEILQTYEAANNNFISISQRLKNAHKTDFSNNSNVSARPNLLSLQFKRTNDSSFVGDNKNPTRYDENLRSLVEISSTSESSTDTETKLKPILGSHNLLENIDWLEFQRAIRKPEGCEDVYGDVTKSGKCNSNKSSNLNTSRINKKYKIYQGVNKHTKEVMKRLRPNTKALSSNQIPNCTEKKSSGLNEKISKFSNSMNDDNKELQDISLNTNVTFLFKDADFYKDVGTMSDIIDVSELHDVDKDSSNNPNSLTILETTNNELVDSFDEVTSKHFLRKNLYLNDNKPSKNKHSFKIPQWEADIKDVLGLISQDLKQERIQTSDAKVNSNVRHYLNKLVSSVILKSELKNNTRSSLKGIALSKTTSNKLPRRESKYESLKASFDKLQRISDHTVLVKWSIPRNIRDVQGYELQVDGRAVQKIFSPTRSIAVVTCLPHSDKILLSIRTLTSNSECNPTTTTVYHPRTK